MKPRTGRTSNQTVKHMKSILASLVLAGLTLGVGTGCSHCRSHSITYLGVARPAPTDPVQIEILQTPPERAHDRLGEVVIDASLNPPPSVQKIEARLRREAAKLGADAVLIAQDQATTTGLWVGGPWWGPTVNTVQSRIIVGVALKYR